jgi:uncharacterized protein (DUF924 family)
MSHQEIITFWFQELSPKEQFSGGQEVDTLIKERFFDIHKSAVRDELSPWRETAEGSLAEVIILDQFSRNIYRGQAEAFAADSKALALAQEAIAKGFDQELPPEKRLFLYMPFMHSESKTVHAMALELFARLGNESSLQFEKIHKDIIDRFGRYPHRNEQLGRETTKEEQIYLQEESESFFKS